MQKQGSSSVGVARQYIDSLGKVKNCQQLLSCHYVDSAFSWPVNAQLYLPREWIQNATRCQRARIPEATRTFLTKPDILLKLLDEANQWGVPYRGVATTAAYGSDSTFLAGLEQRGIEYFVEVPEDFKLQIARRKGPLVEFAREVISRLADDAWQPISWPRSAGSGGRSLWARVMSWRVTSVEQGAFGWLVAERPLSGPSHAVRYFFTNANLQTSFSTLVRFAKRTVNVEEFYRFAKTDLGWNHYEGRLWHGFHRHTLLVFLAYSFLLLLRIQQGRGERRKILY
jgi:SRSO17 transposase